MTETVKPIRRVVTVWVFRICPGVAPLDRDYLATGTS